MFSQKRSSDYYIGEAYPEYFLTLHWIQLKDKLIYSNSKAKCWICEKTNTLLLHHIRYDNLFKERLYRDVYILCYNCHSQLHNYKLFIFFPIKTKLVKRDLVKRMLYLRSKYCIQKKRFFLSLWYVLRYSVT